MATLSDWVYATRRHVLSLHREEFNTLGPAMIDTTGTSVTVSGSLGSIANGAQIEVDLELMLVVGNPSGSTFTVIRGWEGTTPATHLNGALVKVNPRFPTAGIVAALSDAVNDLSGPNYFAVKETNITYDSAVRGYDMGDSNVNSILAVRFQMSATSQLNVWPQLDSYSLQEGMDPAQFPSGNAIFFYQPAYATGSPIRVIYSANFVPLTGLTDNLSLSLVPTSGQDLPPIGAAIRLMAGREIKRNFTEAQGDTRRAAAVPPGAVTNSTAGLQRLYQRRYQSEVSGLIQRFPYRKPRYASNQAAYGRV